MVQRICIKAQSCKTAPSCQHGRPHNPCPDCEVRECFVGGQVRCKPYVEKKGGDNDWQDNEVHPDDQGLERGYGGKP